MPSQVNGSDDTMADTIKVLVATDNHVGYKERDPVRGDDSWKTFHEIMCMAKDRDVDMVLLGGDLFHDNIPTRKSMYNVMRSLRLNCYGDKPCEIELLSDGTEHFDATIGHANYEDPNINVAIPVFSIHGNHDDPSGDGHFAALDILEMSGLINYFGRVPEGNDIQVRPLLIQKGSTKVALYGISNVRDERMYRTFREGDVKFHVSTQQRKDFYNICVVHQNHHAHSPTSYLPENFLPNWLDLVIWGHEHECLIEPHLNPEMNFRVMQPGSSVATSLAPGEAIPKQVAILHINGREMRSEPIRLRTVRPFVYKDIVLSEEKDAVKIAEKENHRHRLTEWLTAKVHSMIAEAKAQWEEAREDQQASDDDDDDDEEGMPLPLIRIRVENSPAQGVKFDLENPQRFSNRFAGMIANKDDVIQLHIKKKNAAARRQVANEELKELMVRPELAENLKVAALVKEFLESQALTILPQNCFGDAVDQYIDKDDKHAMDMFVNESLAKQIRNLVTMHENEEDDGEDEDIATQFEAFRAQMEEMFNKDHLKTRGKAKYRPKPPDWDSDLDGEWEDQPAALITVEKASDEEEANSDGGTPKSASTRDRGRGRGARGRTTTTRGRGGAPAKKKTAVPTRGKVKKHVVEEDSDEEEGVIMVDDDEESDSQAMFFADKGKKMTNGSTRGSRAGSVASSTKVPNGRKAAAPPSTRKTPARAAASRSAKQSTLNFSASQSSIFGGKSQNNVSDIEDDDDDDAFEPMRTTKASRSRR